MRTHSETMRPAIVLLIVALTPASVAFTGPALALSRYTEAAKSQPQFEMRKRPRKKVKPSMAIAKKRTDDGGVCLPQA